MAPPTVAVLGLGEAGAGSPPTSSRPEPSCAGSTRIPRPAPAGRAPDAAAAVGGSDVVLGANSGRGAGRRRGCRRHAVRRAGEMEAARRGRERAQPAEPAETG